MLHLVPPHRVHRPPGGHVVQHMAIGPGYDGGVIGGLGPALNLQAVHPGVHQVVQVVDHAHIPGIHDVGALLVLEHREILPGPFLLHQCVLIAAGLGAGSPVGVPPGHIVGQQAPPGIGHAHGPVAEGLQLQGRVHPAADLPYLVHPQLPGQHHSLGPQVKPRLGAGVVGNGLLGADVPLAPGGIFPGQGKGPQVRQNQGVHPGVVELFQVLRQSVHLAAAGHGVHGGVDLHPVPVGKVHRPGQLLIAEIPRKGPHAEGRPRQVHGVRPVQHGHLQLFPVPCRSQQLRFFSLRRHPNFRRLALCSDRVRLNTCRWVSGLST